MLHAVIIDDESNSLRSLELLIEKFTPDVKIIATATKALKGVDLINDFRPDIVFLDIYMPNLNGFELLKKLEYKNFYLIFTTAHKEFAVSAIKQNATDYLLKPIDAEDLAKAIEKVKQKIKEKQSLPDMTTLLSHIHEIKRIKIPIHEKNNIDYLDIANVLYIEAKSSHSVVAHVNGTFIKALKPLKDYETILCHGNHNFIRIHNSFIVNINYVTKYIREDGGYAVIQNKKTIPISRNKKEEFLKLINFNI